MSTLRALACKKLGLSAAAPQSDIYRAALRALSYTWKPTSDGFRTSDGRAELIKRGSKWVLVMRDGTVYDMPKKPSFDHAEGYMVRHYGN